jgi:hypothetical protein
MVDDTTPTPETPSGAAAPPVRVLLPSDVVQAVRTGNLTDLLDARETDQVDFKSTPYPLDSDRGKQDLAADVASLANAGGGVLVLGVQTSNHPNERVEVASAISGFQPGLVNEERYRKVLQDRVAPLAKDIRFHYGDTERPAAKPHQVAVIEVAPQHKYDKPFIVDRLVDDDDVRTTHAIGWPERSGDGTYWHPKERIQQLIAGGLRPGVPGPPDTVDQTPAEELSVAWTVAGIGEPTPRLAVQVIPVQPASSFEEFFGADREAFRQWRPLRGTGFGFDLGWHQPEANGNHLVATDTDAALVLSRDGILSVVTGFETRGFMWNSPTPDELVQINPFALTEWVTEVLRLAYGFIDPRLQPSGWGIMVFADDLLPNPTVAIRPPQSTHYGPPWSATTAHSQIVTAGTGDWASDAYAILVEIYGQCFGRPPTSVYGADQQARKIDLLAINKFRG